MEKFIQTLKLRFRNYGFCVSFFALIPLFCQMLGVELPLGEFDTLTNAILACLVAAGLVSNPTTQARWYTDDPHENCSPKRCTKSDQ